MNKNLYMGIDLGTTNSAVSIFDGDANQVIQNAHGSINTPSVVRVTDSGIVVGAKAKRHLFNDTDNTFKEFKRLMGTQALTKPDRSGHCWTAEELSSEVLKCLKAMAEQQFDVVLNKVVITVPALFELPQSKATAEAARLAGFQQVEMLPEPVASALASGWSADQQEQAWLVYDLGGGTFDVSLLESRDGLLRVIAHDGDNFLGGRDIDKVIVNWLLEELASKHKLAVNQSDPHYKKFIRQLESAAEEAKITLSDATQTVIELEFELADKLYEIDVGFTRDKLAELCSPLITRSIDICLRLLQSQGLPREQLKRVVLVGGPAHMPIIKAHVQAHLAPLAESQYDPMSLVARGAALYSATVGLVCKSEQSESIKSQSQQVWLQYPSVCSELNPTVMGRIIDDNLKLSSVVITNVDASWVSATIDVDDGGVFIAEVLVKPNKANRFTLQGFDLAKVPIAVVCEEITIIHGIAVSDPPLSRSVGLSLADGSVKTFIDRGTPLPAKRTFVQSLVESLVPGSGQKLNIPIVQGERRKARFCRKVGNLVIDSNELTQTLQVGSPVEITIEVNRGGDLKAQAFLPQQNKLIQGVAQLVISSVEPSSLRASWHSTNSRIGQLQKTAFRERDEQMIVRLDPLATRSATLFKELEKLEDDVDACQRFSRNLMELEAEVEHLESAGEFQLLADECERLFFNASSMVQSHGGEAEKQVLQSCTQQFESALKFQRQGELERLIERLEQLYHAAHKRSPGYWEDQFIYWSSYIHMAKDPKKARALVEKGRQAIEHGEHGKLKSITMELYNLIPEREKGDGESYDSGVF